jgi:hypothetical protein
MFSNRLPFKLTEYSPENLEAASGEIRGGRIFARLNPDWQPAAGDKQPLEKMVVPPGKYLLQLSVEKLQPESWLGKIYGGVIDRIGDFYIVDASGNNFKPIGSYAMAEVNSQKVFELVFLDDIAREAGREIPRFQHLKPQELQGNYSFYFLFHLPPGTRPVRLHTGRHDVDLLPLNLVAPGKPTK